MGYNENTIMCANGACEDRLSCARFLAKPYDLHFDLVFAPFTPDKYGSRCASFSEIFEDEK